MYIIGVFEIRYSHENEPTYWPLWSQAFSARFRHDQKFQKLTTTLTRSLARWLAVFTDFTLARGKPTHKKGGAKEGFRCLQNCSLSLSLSLSLSVCLPLTHVHSVSAFYNFFHDVCIPTLYAFKTCLHSQFPTLSLSLSLVTLFLLYFLSTPSWIFLLGWKSFLELAVLIVENLLS